MKIRGYQLTFIRTNQEILTIGTLVSITGKIPTLRPRPKNSKPNEGHEELGRIMDIQEDERLGTIYVVMEYADGKWHKYIEEKLLPIAPVLVTDDNITTYQSVVINLKTNEMVLAILQADNDYVSVTDTILHKSDVKRVVARPHEIGHVLNYGPPHDRNGAWKWDGEGEDQRLLFLEVLHPDVIPQLFDRGGIVRVVVGEDDKPIFTEGEIVMDAYNLYSSS
jgi:hypothetical protein